MGLCRATGVAAVLTATAWGGAGAETVSPSGLTAMDIFRLSQATDPEIRPDGGMVAYVRNANDIMIDDAQDSIWLVDARTGVQSPVPGVGTKGSQPRWSAGGDRLAFTAEPDGKGRGLYIYTPRSGRTARIASLPHAASALSWSRDGTQIAFIMHEAAAPEMLGAPLVKPPGAKWAEPLRLTTRAMYRKDGKGDLEPGYDHVFVVSARGGTPEEVTSGPFDDSGSISWTAGDDALVFTGRRGSGWERDSLRSAIYSVSLHTKVLTQLTQVPGPCSSATVSPDGKLVAFDGYDDTRRRSFENRLIYVVGADGRGQRVLGGDLDRSVFRPQWAADGRSLYAEYQDHGVTKVALLGLQGGVRTVADGLADDGLDLPYAGGEYSAAEDGTVAFTQGASDRPPELAIARGGQVRRLTALNNALLDQRRMGRVTPMVAVSSVDKAPIDAWIVTPPDFDPKRKWPMILEMHGGPFLDYGPNFATDMQLYAAAGYVVVYANPRGSTSYGAAFADGIDKQIPGIDYDDLMSVVDTALGKGFVDPDRLFVTGGSSGGIMTVWIVGKTHRFRAAVAQRPAVNWTSEALTSDSGFKQMTNWFGKTPWDDPQGFWKHSPLSLVGNVSTPTLVIVGERDIRTPVGEAEQVYGALQFRGVPTGLIKVPGAFHEMAARPSHSAAKAEAVLGWFARYDVSPGRR